MPLPARSAELEEKKAEPVETLLGPITGPRGKGNA
jgi:hypothetical protein